MIIMLLYSNTNNMAGVWVLEVEWSLEYFLVKYSIFDM
jgi:hypothetical protein